MSVKVYYFSSTGNSLYVAKRICEDLCEGEVFSASKLLKDKQFDINADVVGFIYPIHVGSVPIVLEEFLSKVNIEGNPYIFSVGVTGGGGANMSFRHINKLLNGKNKISNYFTIKYVSNYIRAGRSATPERVGESIKKNEPIISEIAISIKNREVKPLGGRLGIHFALYNMWKDLYKSKDKNFNVNDKCVSCDICSRVCPSNNIVLVNGKPTWNKKCSDCLACINLCPKEAINIGKKTVKKERYKHPSIDINELI
ncbi:EFR1 family ferrodoxin [Clostridium cylindrosporum]|uniref:4Fe-4S ferredoxin, iron-sulfur binding domain protein n=1 Tax=Clostridium cylindrosporum DSM 605 TaxID=1121307 RepID=A0A0J8DBM9_CLOCY|nr:EFR1 family ferrodoxin [Clostridium cylindrosporum]KMT23257.1 4Fe-4S ferredoxin, iron-sulfur binding domain protein [Clostridium cylindrosporum DSM 605]